MRRPEYNPEVSKFVVFKSFGFNAKTYLCGETFEPLVANCPNRKARMLYEQHYLDYVSKEEAKKPEVKIKKKPGRKPKPK